MSNKTSSQRTYTPIANYLTIFRMVIIIPVLLLALINTYLVYKTGYPPFDKSIFILIHTLILLFFVAGMVTDYFDGHLARKRNEVSSFGKIFDPIADKLITNITLLYLVAMNFLPIWAFGLLLFRDVLVGGLRTYLASQKVDVSADIFGKLKTLVLSIGIIITLILMFLPAYISNLNTEWFKLYVSSVVIYVGIGLGLISGFIYFWKARKYLSPKITK
ncbi:CDP-diacylglycerol--glycerol-3-phosphate 3-phosphatidyltransferase [Mycoplasma nasistruthionis]|uniref:CDP-diacylglycerol--glycerol-3-phosphate 3-phosphatidyltransferase n=1 Tax=Mycoplasma nasistruthionis TaxID=353852 RepID=A0A4Y6I5M1_9MOLU|nr:CDP-diacylglycerol--glycerol-3-phosphate 3-phosphatidyltransferase [Mycoplasma nasistruthionis]QDF64916.1 CDP-diacylglycerol--glycerol-3-phosphate 3-phosphatidyltransferase [Mycoplasma nasistruthionis]